jgi:hypothetical protein
MMAAKLFRSAASLWRDLEREVVGQPSNGRRDRPIKGDAVFVSQIFWRH